MKVFVSLGNRAIAVELRQPGSSAPNEYEIELEGVVHRVRVEAGHVLVDGHVVPCLLDEGVGQVHFRAGSCNYSISTVDPTLIAARRHTHVPELRAPMPGKLVELRVAEGASVQAGRCLAVIEAMKMQNELSVPFDARVTRIHVTAGAAVEAGALLLELEALETPSATP